MRVDEERMGANLDRAHGLFFSEKVLTALIESGLERQAAYKLVQRNAMKCWESGADFRSLLDHDPEITARLTPADLDHAFDLNAFLAHIEAAYRRLELD